MKRSFYFLLAALFIFNFSSAQSGWVKEKNNFFVKSDFSYYRSSDYRNINGAAIQTSKFIQKSLLLYGEYGITNNLTGIVNIPLLRQQGYNTTNVVTGVGDLAVELKYALSKSKYPIALSIIPEIPLGTQGLQAVAKDGSGSFINLPTGDGEFNVWTVVAASHSFFPKPAFVSAYGGVNYRTEYANTNFQNQYKAGVELGYKLKNKLWLAIKYNVLSGIGRRPAFADFIRGNGSSYSAYSVSGMLETGRHWGINVLYHKLHSGLIKARNIYPAGLLSVGISYARKR